MRSELLSQTDVEEEFQSQGGAKRRAVRDPAQIGPRWVPPGADLEDRSPRDSRASVSSIRYPYTPRDAASKQQIREK